MPLSAGVDGRTLWSSPTARKTLLERRALDADRADRRRGRRLLGLERVERGERRGRVVRQREGQLVLRLADRALGQHVGRGHVAAHELDEPPLLLGREAIAGRGRGRRAAAAAAPLKWSEAV